MRPIRQRAQALRFDAFLDLRLFPFDPDIDLALEGLEFRPVNGDLCFSLDFFPATAVFGDQLGKPPHSDGVEGIVLVDRRQRRLIKLGQGNGLECKATRLQFPLQRRPDIGDEGSALLVKRVHGPGCRDALDGVDKVAAEEVRYSFLVQRPRAQRLRGSGDSVFGRDHADVERSGDIHPQPVCRQDGPFAVPSHLDMHGPHVHGFHLMQEGQHPASAVHDDSLAARTGTDQRPLSRSLAVKAVHRRDKKANYCEDSDPRDQPNHWMRSRSGHPARAAAVGKLAIYGNSCQGNYCIGK